jgi:hypothetical protein
MSGLQSISRVEVWRAAPWYLRTVWVSITILFIAPLWPLLFDQSFFVSAACLAVILWPSVVIAASFGVGIVAFIAYSERHPWPGLEELQRRSRFMKWALVPMFFALLVGFVETVVIPSLMNRTFGRPFEASYTIKSKVHERIRFSECYRLDIQEFSDDWYGKLCIGAANFAAVRAGDHVTLYGTRSWFGTEVKQYSIQK